MKVLLDGLLVLWVFDGILNALSAVSAVNTLNTLVLMSMKGNLIAISIIMK